MGVSVSSMDRRQLPPKDQNGKPLYLGDKVQIMKAGSCCYRLTGTINSRTIVRGDLSKLPASCTECFVKLDDKSFQILRHDALIKRRPSNHGYQSRKEICIQLQIK